MSASRPEFHLRRVTADGDAGPVEVYPVRELPADTQMGRRGFLGAGLAMSSVLSVIGCGKKEATEPLSSPPPSVDREVDIAAPLASEDEPSVVTRAKQPPPDKGPVPTPVYAHSYAVASLAISPDGKLLASATGSEVKLWSLQSWRSPQTIPTQGTSGPHTIAITPDGKRLLSCGYDRVNVWTLPDGKPDEPFECKGTLPRTVATSAKGQFLVVGGGAGEKIHRWSLVDGIPSKRIEGVRGNVFALAITSDGTRLVAGLETNGLASHGNIYVWSLQDGRSEKAYFNFDSPISDLALSPDNTVVAYAAGDSPAVHVRPFPSGKPSRAFMNYEHDNAQRLVITPDSKTLICGAGTRVMLWSLSDGQHVQTLARHGASITALALASDGKLLASGDRDGVIILWDLTTGKFLSYLFDPKASKTDANTYHVQDAVTGQTRTYTLPCGSPIPAGATCTCNCVQGTYRVPVPASSGGFGGSFCTCNKICTCIPVCQAHKLLHPDPRVRTLAEELLLVMGEAEFPYMRWAADAGGPQVREQIHRVMAAIRNGAAPDPARWPAVDDCFNYLDDADEVVGIMAAQAVALRSPDAVQRIPRIRDLLARAEARPWYLRTPSI